MRTFTFKRGRAFAAWTLTMPFVVWSLAMLFTFLSVFASASVPSNSARSECRKQTQQQLDAMTSRLDQEYRTVESRGIWPGQSPFWIDNNSRTLLLMVHGFISSPRDQAPISQALESMSASGPVVDRYSVLLNGYGSGPFIANLKGVDDWKASILNSMTALAPCYDRIAFIGHSLGGGLIADLILHHPEMNLYRTYLGKPIVGQILLAPYMRPLKPELELLNRWAKHEGLPYLDLNLLRAIEQLIPGGSLGLPLPRKRGTWESTPYVPLVAAGRLFDFADSFTVMSTQLAQGTLHPVVMPTLLIQAAEDGLVDNSFASLFAARAFLQVETWLIPAGLDTHHFLHQPEDNAQFPQMMEQIRDFLNRI